MALLVTGCATPGGSVDAADMAGISRIGVVAGLSDELNHIQVGANFFADEWQVRMVPEWQISEVAETTLASAIANSATSLDVGIVDVSTLERRSFSETRAGLLSAARMQGFDAVALILPMWPQSQSKIVPGIGVFKSQSFGIVNRCVYQQTMVYLLDAASGKHLAREHGYNVWEGSCRDSSVPFKSQVEAYSRSEMDALKKEIEAAFDYGLARSARRLGFGS